MTKFIIFSLIIFAFLRLCKGAEDFEFYADEKYYGSLPFFKGNGKGEWPEQPTGCFNFPPDFQRRLSSIKTQSHDCILIFTEPSCQGRSFKITEDVESISALQGNVTFDNFDNLAMSVRLCTPEEGSPDKINVAVYSSPNYQDVSQEYSNLCKCVSVAPGPANQFKSIDNHHNCIRLFSSPNCNLNEGIHFDVFPGKTSKSADLSKEDIYGSIGSFRPCQSPPACFKLAADVYKIVVIDENDENSILANSNFLSMSTRTTIVNNGSASISQEYSARKEVKETLEIEKVTFDRRIESWGRLESKSSSWNINIVIPIKAVTLSIGVSIANSLQTAYQETNENSEMNRELYISEKTTEFGVRQVIEVGPCSSYTVESLVKVVDDYPIHYQMHFTLQGEYQNKRMRWDELEREVQSMDEYTFAGAFDEYTINVYSQAKITSSFGVETKVEGVGQRLSTCL